jgi:hypothetical protein
MNPQVFFIGTLGRVWQRQSWTALHNFFCGNSGVCILPSIYKEGFFQKKNKDGITFIFQS